MRPEFLGQVRNSYSGVRRARGSDEQPSGGGGSPGAMAAAPSMGLGESHLRAEEPRGARQAAGQKDLAARCSHGRHLRRLCGRARLLPRPAETDLTGCERAPFVSGSPPNFG